MLDQLILDFFLVHAELLAELLLELFFTLLHLLVDIFHDDFIEILHHVAALSILACHIVFVSSLIATQLIHHFDLIFRWSKLVHKDRPS